MSLSLLLPVLLDFTFQFFFFCCFVLLFISAIFTILKSHKIVIAIKRSIEMTMMSIIIMMIMMMLLVYLIEIFFVYFWYCFGWAWLVGWNGCSLSFLLFVPFKRLSSWLSKFSLQAKLATVAAVSS